MTINLTEEQQEVADYIGNLAGEDLVIIDSVAGSGKTTLLQAIAGVLKGKPGLYLAYNKAIATSSSKKFPSNIECRTTHSLAYRAVVKPLGLKVGFFGVREVKEKIPYSQKCNLVDDIKEFCLSKYLSYEDYAKDEGKVNTKLAEKYLSMMGDGSMECSHDFYLKVFHILLHGDDIEMPKQELVMLDEAGDLNEVTLEIFRLLPSRVKVAVGDPHQNIYTFNHTINCFKELNDEGTVFKLSRSFRVPQHIAGPVEKFCKQYLDETMEFSGVDTKGGKVVTRGYISRTNSGLIGKIIELNRLGAPYGLVRKAKEIFKTPLMVAGLKYQGKVFNQEHKHVQEAVNDWFENEDGIKVKYPTMFGYLMFKFKEDVGISQAVKIILKYGKSEIFEAYSKAKEHEEKSHDFTLLTAHSCKGLEFDEVTLAPDMNYAVDMVIERQGHGPYNDSELPISDKETLNLYYVACTRALVRLHNATHLS